MTASVLPFPTERVIRTREEAEAHRKAQFDANVMRLVEILEATPWVCAMAEAKIARDRASGKLPS